MSGERFYVVGTRGVGYWPDGVPLSDAQMYQSKEDAENVLKRAALTEWGRRESGVHPVEIVGGMRKIVFDD